MNKKGRIYVIVFIFMAILVVAIIFPFMYPLLYIYLIFSLIYIGIIVRDIETFGKIAIGTMIVSFVIYFLTLNLELIDNLKVIKNLISDAGMLFFFIYLLIIIPKYSSKFHMGFEDSGVGKYHIHEGFVGLVLYAILSVVFFIPVMILYLTPWDISFVHPVCLVVGGAGNIISTFFIGRDWEDIKHGLLIEKIEDGSQPEEHEDFWKSPPHLLKKYTKLNDFTTGFILCGSAVGLYYSPLFSIDSFVLGITVFSLCLLTFGGFLIGRSWIDMLKDRYNETINRPLLLSLKDSLGPDQKIISVDSICYPIWIVVGFLEKKKRKWIFFKKKIKMEKIILIDDSTGKFLCTMDHKIERIDEYNEEFEININYIKGYKDIERNLLPDKIMEYINFLEGISISPGILPLYAIKLKNQSTDKEEFLGVHLNSGHTIELFHDYSINYLMPFEDEGKVIKSVLFRFSSFLKRLFLKRK
ncbi:MAG: hypothetical protein ACTSPY_01320 [Candidatus Helarchaeota archaeon]